MKIGIIIGSVRDGRLGEQVGKWVAKQAAKRSDADYETIDLKSFDVPILTASVNPAAAKKRYDSEAVQRWSDAVDACDGFVFVTPEYNHGVPGAMKNAFDSLGDEWRGKTVAFVSYGADNGVRAVEQWRQIVVNFEMVDVRSTVSLSLFTDVTDGTFKPERRRAGELKKVLDDLVAAIERQGKR